MLYVIFGLIGMMLILLVDKELDLRVKKELLKSNQIMKIIKLLVVVELVIFFMMMFGGSL